MRRLVYLLALAGLTTKSLGQQKQQQQPLSATAKPNVVFILTDDQDAHLGSLDYMPYVQKHLLDKGTHYRSHYCTTSVCCPSRVTLWTGKLAHNTNVTDVNPPHGGYPKIISQGLNDNYLPVWLQEAGYNTYYTGKLFNVHTVDITVADVINAIDYAIPAIEIIDSRVKNWAIDLPDTLADNGSTGAIILGGTPRKLTELTLNDTRGVLKHNGKELMTGNTKNVLGNPISAVAWLVNRLAEYDIEFLAGQVIMPGSCLEAIPMEVGQWTCTFEGWGTIEFDVV
ncbi:hypothetical protein CBS147353_11448 [Aspergillus niger]|nr:hypothetical protein CBS147353_11448 [Aspergillus niger]